MPGVGERLAEAALTAHRDEQGGQGPDRHPRVPGPLGGDQCAPGRLLPRPRLAPVGERPALLSEHRDLLGGAEPVEAAARHGDELVGPVLQGQGADEGEPQRGVGLGSVPPVEDGLGSRGRLRHQPGAEHRLDDLHRHGVGVGVAPGQEGLGPSEQLDRDGRRPACRPPRAAARSHVTASTSPRWAPSTRWSATSSGSAPAAMSVTAASRCRARRSAVGMCSWMASCTSWCRNVTRSAVPSSRWASYAGARCAATSVSARRATAERSRSGTASPRTAATRSSSSVSSGQVAQPADHQLAQRGRQRGGRRVDPLLGAAQHPLVGQGPEERERPQRVPAGAGEHRGERRARRGPQPLRGQRDEVLGGQRREPEGVRARVRQVADEAGDVGGQGRGPHRHDHAERREGKPANERRDRHQARRVGPLQVLEHEEEGLHGARGLDEVDDLLDDAVLQVARPRRRGPPGEERPDGCPAGVGVPAPQAERRRDQAERPGALEGVGLRPQHRHVGGHRRGEERLHEARLADAGLALDDECREAPLGERAEGRGSRRELDPAPDDPLRSGHAQGSRTRGAPSRAPWHGAGARSRHRARRYFST